MNDIMWYAFIIGGIGFILLYIKRHVRQQNLPPGPKGWPLVGNAFQQDPKRPHLTWSEWGQTFGDVFTVNNFGTTAVLCNSYEAIYEMFVTKSADFAGRPEMYAFDRMTDDRRDVVGADFSPEWNRRKKVFMNNIKMSGEGLKYLEELMVDTINELVNDIKKSNQPLDLEKPIIFALANTLALLLLGHKYERTDEDFQTLLEILDDNCEALAISLQSIAIDCFPWMRHLPLPLCNLTTKHSRQVQHEWGPKLIQKKMETYDKNKPDCILDAYIKQYEEDRETDVQYPIEYRNLVMFIADFFFAGVNTSRSVLYSMFAILTAKQDIQAKVREEVDRVLGGRHPELKDRLDMPYFQAMLEEVLRYSVVVPTSVPHKAMVDSEICGYFIPKGTLVIPNMWQLCHDVKFWKDPSKFRPERFLDDDGQILSLDHPLRKRVLTFGAGRRKCPGETLARNRIFLIVTSLLQKFVFKPADENHPPPHDPSNYKLGLTLFPQPYQVIAVTRE